MICLFMEVTDRLDILDMFPVGTRHHCISQCLNHAFSVLLLRCVDCWLGPILFYFWISNMFLVMKTKLLLLGRQFKVVIGAVLYS